MCNLALWGWVGPWKDRKGNYMMERKKSNYGGKNPVVALLPFHTVVVNIQSRRPDWALLSVWSKYFLWVCPMKIVNHPPSPLPTKMWPSPSPGEGKVTSCQRVVKHWLCLAGSLNLRPYNVSKSNWWFFFFSFVFLSEANSWDLRGYNTYVYRKGHTCILASRLS